jgi:hypothetical protein
VFAAILIKNFIKDQRDIVQTTKREFVVVRPVTRGCLRKHDVIAGVIFQFCVRHTFIREIVLKNK